jgi:predicted MPP superfamily phosphohydrolase
MKHLLLGDIHGNPIWKEIVNKETFDKVIFVGDYLDTHYNITGEQQLSNYLDIIEFKKNNIDKVVLLLGNHDYHYLNMGEHYSGFQSGWQYQFQPVLEENLKYHQMCYKFDNYMCSHAGISKVWLENVGYSSNETNPALYNIEDFVNAAFIHKPTSFRFTSGRNRSSYGDDITQSPIWIRPDSLKLCKVEPYIHIVGHTTQRNLNIKQYENIYLIDSLTTSKEYLTITDNKTKISQL